MDKTTFSKYGWILVTTIVLVIIIAGAPAIGNSINDNALKNLISNIESYTVTLEPTGGEIPFADVIVVPGKMYGYLPTPTCDGKVFSGWYTSPTGGEKVTSQTIYSGASDHVLYARWD